MGMCSCFRRRASKSIKCRYKAPLESTKEIGIDFVPDLKRAENLQRVNNDNHLWNTAGFHSKILQASEKAILSVQAILSQGSQSSPNTLQPFSSAGQKWGNNYKRFFPLLTSLMPKQHSSNNAGMQHVFDRRYFPLLGTWCTQAAVSSPPGAKRCSGPIRVQQLKSFLQTWSSRLSSDKEECLLHLWHTTT